MLASFLGWLVKDKKREREIERNCAVARAAQIDPVYEEGIPNTFLVVIEDALNANDVWAFVELIDKRISKICEEDSVRYERQRMSGGVAANPLTWKAKRVVVRNNGQNKPALVMEWFPKEIHFNVRPDEDD